MGDTSAICRLASSIMAFFLFFVSTTAWASFQYTEDRLIGVDLTPRNLWYFNGNKNLVCVRSMGGNDIHMFIAKDSVKVVPNKQNIVVLAGDVYQRSGRDYVKNTFVYLYAVDDAGQPTAYGGLGDKVAAAAQQGIASLQVSRYGSWQGKGDARIAEMFYYIATGKKFFGNVSIDQLPNTADYRKAKAQQATSDYDVTLMYWYSQDVYDRCNGK